MSDSKDGVVTGEPVEPAVVATEPTEPTPPPGDSDEVVNLRKEVSGLRSAASSERHKRQTAEAEIDRLNIDQTPPSVDNDAINRAVDNRMAQATANQQQVEANKQWDERIEAGQKTHADVNIADVIQDETFYPHISDTMAEVIRSTDDGINVMLYLNTNRDELHRISQLPPMQAAQQMGRISEQLKTAGEAPISNAPDPITPVGSTSVSNKDPDDMSAKEYETYIKEKNGGSVFPRR